jgi:formate C-acetyltransferase
MNNLPDRIIRLRDELFAVKSETCFERAKALTASYKNSEREPSVIRRAKGLRDILRHTPIYIREDELLVGAISSRLGWRTAFPEYNIKTGAPWPAEVAEYWTGKTIGDLSANLHTDAVKQTSAEMAACYVTGTATGFGHMIVDYGKVVRRGLLAVMEDAKAAEQSAGDDAKGRDFCRAVVISCQAVIDWANRYADLAEELAASASEVRRGELLNIAKICRRVPAHPAESFHEALQAFWFTHIVLHIEQQGWSISAGRFDQYMFPCYQKDIDSGASRNTLFELLLNLWVKFMENVGAQVKQTTFQNFTIGGRDAEGQDMSNGLSRLCLDATLHTSFVQPALSVRWHDNMDPDFREHVMRVIAAGTGMPALFNDRVITSALEYNGVSREDALDYGIVGCVEASPSGKMQGLTAGGHINLAKALELALFDGRSLTSGVQLGLHTGDAARFGTFEELFGAYAKQSRWLAGVNIQSAQIAGDSQKQRGHCPFTSALLDDCIGKRRDMVDGGTRYSLSGVAIVGATNAVDGLMTLKKFVFDEKRYTMAEVCAALKADFEGYEVMRQTFLHSADRFGNDVDEVDALANRVYAIHADFSSSHPDARGGHYTCGIWPVTQHVQAGVHTGAAPDGRRRGEPLVDGVGACQGADRNGPTALLSSVSRLDNVHHWAAGNTCNVKFSRTSVESGDGLQKLTELVDTFIELGGQELQINVVDGETLRDAQEHPEEYANLVVRVAGYSAYFVTLSKAIQDEVISRMEQRV